MRADPGLFGRARPKARAVRLGRVAFGFSLTAAFVSAAFFAATTLAAPGAPEPKSTLLDKTAGSGPRYTLRDAPRSYAKLPREEEEAPSQGCGRRRRS